MAGERIDQYDALARRLKGVDLLDLSIEDVLHPTGFSTVKGTWAQILENLGNAQTSDTYPNSIGFNGITPDKNDAVFVKELRFSDGATAGFEPLITQQGNDMEVWGNYDSNNNNGLYLTGAGFSHPFIGVQKGLDGAQALDGIYGNGNEIYIQGGRGGVNSYFVIHTPLNTNRWEIYGETGAGGEWDAIVISDEYYITRNTSTPVVTISSQNVITNGDTYRNCVSLGGSGITIDKSNYAFAQNLEVQGGVSRYSATPALATDLDMAHKGYVDRLFDRAATTFSGNLTATTVSVINDWYSITNTQPYSFTQRGTSFEQDDVVSGQINALSDNTVKTITAYVNVVLAGAGTNKLEIAIFKNGAALPERGYRAVAGAYGTIQVISPNVSVSNTDTFELKIRNTDAAGDVIVRNAVISID